MDATIEIGPRPHGGGSKGLLTGWPCTGVSAVLQGEVSAHPCSGRSVLPRRGASWLLLLFALAPRSPKPSGSAEAPLLPLGGCHHQDSPALFIHPWKN